jgi:hypothetical protein
MNTAKLKKPNVCGWNKALRCADHFCCKVENKDKLAKIKLDGVKIKIAITIE